MEPSAALSTSAQIAVAIAGFAGVVVAVRNESVRNWGRVEKFWLRLLLVNSILPLTLSVVGLLFLAIKPVPPPATWRWCSGFAALFLFPYTTMIFKSLLGFTSGELKAAGGGRFTSNTLFALLTAVCLLQLYNLTTLAAFWPYFVAIVSLLLGAMYQFVRLILNPHQPGT